MIQSVIQLLQSTAVATGHARQESSAYSTSNSRSSSSANETPGITGFSFEPRDLLNESNTSSLRDRDDDDTATLDDDTDGDGDESVGDGETDVEHLSLQDINFEDISPEPAGGDFYDSDTDSYLSLSLEDGEAGGRGGKGRGDINTALGR